jgi:mRNA interferase RelE/StbE
MEIAFTPAAWRDWQKLPHKIQSRLDAKLTFYARDPLRYGVKLTDSGIGQYRFRVGDYRIVFDVAESKIVVLAVGNRKDIYKG